MYHLTGIFNRNLLTAYWSRERVIAEGVAYDARCDKDSVFLARERKAELLGISWEKSIGSVSCSACAVVVLRSVDA
jgi:hypothetical protein